MTGLPATGQTPLPIPERYGYRHHGFTLGSNQPLARLTPAPTQAPDISIDVLDPGQLPDDGLAWEMCDPPRTAWRARTEMGSRLRMRYEAGREWAEFVVDENGSTVTLARAEDVPLPDAAELLLGPVFSCVLSQRGLTCVHAAVVALHGRAIALAGPAGAGKSSTALALLRFAAGSLVADDVATLTDLRGRPAALAGPARLRMRADSARSLAGSFEALDPMWVGDGVRQAKRYLSVAEGAAWHGEGPVALDALYFLVRRSDAVPQASVTALTPAESLARLMLHRHMAGALDRSAHARDLPVLARLTEAAPARELLTPDGIEHSEHVASVISADVRSLA